MASRILAYFRGTPNTPTQTPEVRVKNYLDLFRQAIQNQNQPQNQAIYDPKDLQDLQAKAPVACESDLELVLWMAHILKYPDCVRASFTNGHPNLEILPKALEMSGSEFVALIEPLTTKVECRVVVQDRNYTSTAISMFVVLVKGGLNPNLLSPETTYTLKLKDGKSRDFTGAEMAFLGLGKYAAQRALAALLSKEPIPEKKSFDFPDIEEQTLQVLYDIFTLKSYTFSQLPSDQLFRLTHYLQKPEVDSALLMQHPVIQYLDSSLQNSKEIILSEDCLERKDFQAETKALLAVCQKATHVTIRQSGDFFLKLSRATFEEFLNKDPAFKKIIKCKNDKTCEVALDFYLEIMTYMSQARTLRGFKPFSEIDLSEHFEKETIAHAYHWFKSGQYPTLSWREEAKLVSFLDFCSPESERHKLASLSLSKKIPCFTVEELNNMTWENLIDELRPYSRDSSVQLGKEVYKIANLSKLRKTPLQNLAKPIYLKLANGSIVKGSHDWLSDPAEFLDSSKENPIQVTDEVLKAICVHAENPQPFRQHKLLDAFFQRYAKTHQDILLRNKLHLRSCPLIHLGNASLAPEKYWSNIRNELTNFPWDQKIQLDGCEIVWPRGIVDAFIAHGTIQIVDLSRMITLKFSDEKGTTVHRIYQAEWMCFTDKAPSEIQSRKELDGVISCLSLFREGACRELALTLAWSSCKHIAKPFFKSKIELLLARAASSRESRFRQSFSGPRPGPHLGPHFGPPKSPEDPPWSVTISLLACSAIYWAWKKYRPSDFSTVKDLILNKYAIVIGGCAIGAAYLIFSNRQRIRDTWNRITWKQAVSVVATMAVAGAVGLLWMTLEKKALFRTIAKK